MWCFCSQRCGWDTGAPIGWTWGSVCPFVSICIVSEYVRTFVFWEFGRKNECLICHRHCGLARLLDTAAFYGNEDVVGRAVRQAVDEQLASGWQAVKGILHFFNSLKVMTHVFWLRISLVFALVDSNQQVLVCHWGISMSCKLQCGHRVKRKLEKSWKDKMMKSGMVVFPSSRKASLDLRNQTEQPRFQAQMTLLWRP